MYYYAINYNIHYCYRLLHFAVLNKVQKAVSKNNVFKNVYHKINEGF